MPRFFFRTANAKPMNTNQKPSPTSAAASSRHVPRPRLDRRNAAKHFDYDASTSSSSSAATHASSRVSALDDSNGSLHTRSLDSDLQTSFRVEGSEGEIEFIFKNLGLSGIEDFSIPVDAWEARNIRSVSDVLPRSRLNWADSFREVNEKETEEEEVKERVGEEKVVARNELAGARVLTELTRARGGRLAEDSGRIDVVELRSRERDELGSGMNGIRGSRPPMLQPPPLLRPPPSMRLPVIDNTRSTWDLLRDFAPAENGDLDMHDDARFAPSLDEEEEKEEVVAIESKVERIMAEREQDRGIRIGETRALYTSCSSTSSGDDSPSGNYNVSPNMRGMRTITSWEKGQLLGRGSFGSVYEGIAE